MNIRRATLKDVPGITACVCEAYVHYIERIGKRPGPMLEDFNKTVATHDVYVAHANGSVVGVIVLEVNEEGFYVDNVAVRPNAKGSGVGRSLLKLAEDSARRQGYDSLYLATHELMVENRDLYTRIGYIEYDHRVVNGYPRVFFRKALL